MIVQPSIGVGEKLPPGIIFDKGLRVAPEIVECVRMACVDILAKPHGSWTEIEFDDRYRAACEKAYAILFPTENP